MEELYRYPEVYDAMYRGKAYDGETRFVVDQLRERAGGGDAALVVGCGTGEHSRRLVERGFAVTGVDKHPPMVRRARAKVDGSFVAGALPDLGVGGTYDLVLAPFTVVNYLPPGDVERGLEALVGRLADDGVLVFDVAQLPAEDQDVYPLFQFVPTDDGPYARLFQVRRVDEDAARWESVVFTPDGGVVLDHHVLYHHPGERLLARLEDLGLRVDVYDGYDVDDPEAALTVLVAQRDD